MIDHLYCSRCLVPLSRRERLFESLLCGACEQKLTAYHGSLPDPNLAFHRFTGNAHPSDGHPRETDIKVP